HKAVERDVEHRYSSAAAFADDLRRILEGREVTARAPTTVERFVRVVRRNRALSAAVAVAAAATLAGGAFSAYEARVAVREAAAARREAAAKATALGEAQAAVDYLTDLLASCTPEKDGHEARVLDVATRAAGDIEQRFRRQPLVLSGVQLALGR